MYYVYGLYHKNSPNKKLKFVGLTKEENPNLRFSKLKTSVTVRSEPVVEWIREVGAENIVMTVVHQGSSATEAMKVKRNLINNVTHYELGGFNVKRF